MKRYEGSLRFACSRYGKEKAIAQIYNRTKFPWRFHGSCWDEQEEIWCWEVDRDCVWANYYCEGRRDFSCERICIAVHRVCQEPNIQAIENS